MIHAFRYRSAVFFIGVSLIVLAGCAGTQPSRFYLLHPLAGAGALTRCAVAEYDFSIGIGPVALPQYLNRPQIVTRANPNELRIAEFERWAESLEHNVTRVLTENLSALLAKDRIAVFSWRTSTPFEYQVVLEVTRFDGQPGADVSLETHWMIFEKAQDKLILKKKTSYTTTAGADYSTMVAAQSRLMTDLSRDIAGSIKNMSRKFNQ